MYKAVRKQHQLFRALGISTAHSLQPFSVYSIFCYGLFDHRSQQFEDWLGLLQTTYPTLTLDVINT